MTLSCDVALQDEMEVVEEAVELIQELSSVENRRGERIITQPEIIACPSCPQCRSMAVFFKIRVQ